MTDTYRRLLLSLALVGWGAGCAPVRLIEDHDPRIEQGMTEYQQALDAFVNGALANYETCQIQRRELALLNEMTCTDGSAEVRQLCSETIAAERVAAEQHMEASCTAASYLANRFDFYIQQEARLSVLKTRASILDSMGICVKALNGVNNVASSAVPESIVEALGTKSTAAASNCTEIVVNTVLLNHRALALTHRCIDSPGPDPCPKEFHDIDPATWDSAEQASFFFPTMFATLLQNIRIVLFLEEAKKRGTETEQR